MDAKQNAQLNAAEIETRLERVKTTVWSKANAATDWAEAGDLGHVLSMVKEIEKFLIPEEAKYE